MSPLGAENWRTPPSQVRDVLSERILVDGYHLVLDMKKSQGSHLVDAATGKSYLDFFSMFASQPLGANHPGLTEPAFLEKMGRLATQKPVNSDVYTQPYADFVATFGRIIPEDYPHLFFIEGGSLAVENAMKVAFDWKMQKNIAAGLDVAEADLSIAHFEDAFHGRSGYTLSVTNTADPNKTKYFPKFSWPRLPSPSCSFPMEGKNLEDVLEVEMAVFSQLDKSVADRPGTIAAVLIETIQGEGGDNHFRPAFLGRLRAWCDANEALLIFDEVQVGMGVTGRWWAFEGLGVRPDIFAFGKKSQVCGIAVNRRIEDVDHCFKVSSRINSTWGGNLVDMVRVTRFIEIIEGEKLLEHVREAGRRLLEGLQGLAEGGKVSNVRGQGLFCAFDLPTPELRDKARAALNEAGVLILGCGHQSLRFRPVLDIPFEDIEEGLVRIRRVVDEL